MSIKEDILLYREMRIFFAVFMTLALSLGTLLWTENLEVSAYGSNLRGEPLLFNEVSLDGKLLKSAILNTKGGSASTYFSLEDLAKNAGYKHVKIGKLHLFLKGRIFVAVNENGKVTGNGKPLKSEAIRIEKKKIYVTKTWITDVLRLNSDEWKDGKRICFYSKKLDEIPLYTRLLNSGEYEYSIKDGDHSFGAMIQPKDPRYRYVVFSNQDYIELEEIEIYLYVYDLKNRNKVIDILRMTGDVRDEVFKSTLLSVLKEEIYEVKADSLIQPSAIIYTNNRRIQMFKNIMNGDRKFILSVGLINKTYEPNLVKDIKNLYKVHTDNLEQEIIANEY